MFTVGVGKSPIQAIPNNNPNTISSDLSSSAHITTITGMPFITYHHFNDYMIRFETPDFRNGPDFFTINLLFTKCGSPCYTEPEPISITIINTPPVIDNPKDS